MSQITRLDIANLKRSTTRAYAFKPLTIITGTNSSGKSSVLDAITLALLGFHPALGKTNAATMQLASAESMSVGLTIDNRLNVNRRWTRNGKRITKTESEDTASPEVKALAAAITAGADFINAKPLERAMRIRAAAQKEGNPMEEVVEAMGLQGELAEMARRKQPADSPDFSEWVEEYLKECKNEKSAANAVVQRMEKTIQGLAHLAEPFFGEVPTQEELSTLVDFVAKTKAQAEQLAKQSLDDLGQQPVQPDHYKEGVDYQGIQERADGRLKTIRAAVSEASKQLAEAKRNQDLRDHMEEILRIKLERLGNVNRDTIKAELEQILSAEPPAYTGPKVSELEQIARRASTQAQIAEDIYRKLYDQHATQAQTCHCCGADRAHWSPDKAAREETALAAAKSKMEQAAAESAAALTALADASLNAAAAAEKRDKWERARGTFELLQDIEGTEASIKQLPPVPDLDAEEMDHMNSRAHSEMEAIDEAQECIDYERALEQFGQISARAGAKSEEAQKLCAEAKEAEEVLERKRAAFNAAQAQRNQAAQQEAAEAELEKARTELTNWGTIADRLEIAAKQVAESSLRPVLELAKMITGAILPTALGSRGFEIGRWEGPRWIPLDVFSGSEKAIAKAAIDTALAAMGSRIVIIDEFSILTDERKADFLFELARAIKEGVLNQAIIVDNRPSDHLVPDGVDYALIRVD